MLFQEIEGETVLLDVERQHYYGLDAVGTRVWQLLVERRTVDALVSAMLSEFDVDEATLRRDVAALLDRLKAEGLIVSEPLP